MANGERGNVAPPSRWLTSPIEVNGLTKNEVSETVFANPTLTNGVTDEKLWLKLFVQSTVTCPVLKPRSLLPVGAVASTVDVKFTESLSAKILNPRYALPSPDMTVLGVCVVEDPLTI